MIAASLPRHRSQLGTRVLELALAVVASLLAAYAVRQFQDLAFYALVFAIVAVLTFWRPRYGLYALFILIAGFEAQPIDTAMYPGWLAQSDISTWSPLGFVNFKPVELLVIITVIAVLAQSVVARRWFKTGQLWLPLLLFSLLMTVSLAYGVGRSGGDLNKGLWEVRSLFLGVLVALLVPSVLTETKHLEHLVNWMVVAAVLLSIDIIIRRYTIYAGITNRGLDLAFNHETPVFMDFAVVLLLARLIWPAGRKARLAALAIPLLIYAQMVTERRSGWVCLDASLIVLMLFVFRLRRRVFYWVVVPLLLVYCGYLVGFWNNQSPLGQPARAVRSINNPEGRDQSSNLYRLMETTDVRLNIHAHPLTGLGFGQQYIDYAGLPDLSANWPFFHYMTHNALLWVWMKMGPAGMWIFLIVIGGAIVRGIQILKSMQHDRAAPILVAFICAVVMMAIYSYVDLSLTNVRAAALLGLSIGVIGAWGRLVSTTNSPKP